MATAVLPAEILSLIICFLSPREVVRLRTVSKQFRDISRLVEVWRTLYVNAPLPRYPSPFPSRSAQFLERSLVRSEQLAESWTTQPMRDISTLRIPLVTALDGIRNFSSYKPKIINGEWLVLYDPPVGFLAHNINTKTAPGLRQILWKPEETVRFWDACGVTSVHGPVFYIMFRASASLSDLTLPSKLLEFRMDDTFSCIYHSFSFDIPAERTREVVFLDGGHGPFLYMSRQELILDTRTRQLFKIPPFSSSQGHIPPGWRPARLAVPLEKEYTLLTKTHVITLYPVVHDVFGHSTVVRAWMLPLETHSIHNDAHYPPLRLSHEVIMERHVGNITLLRNSIIDPVTEATNIRLLDQAERGSAGVHFSCIDVTLLKHIGADTSTALSMKIQTRDIFAVDDVLDGRRRFESCHLDSSDDGHARGLWQVCPRNTTMLSWFPSHWEVVRFSIDASSEKCTFSVGHALSPRWKQLGHPFRLGSSWVDCLRGRFCYTGKHDGDKHVIVVDVV